MVDNIEAGRDLDVLIAEKVMGSPMPPLPNEEDSFSLYLSGSPIRSEDGSWICVHIFDHGDVPEWQPLAFSTDIKAAMLVVRQMFRQPEDVYDKFLSALTRHCPVSNNTPDKVMGWWLPLSNQAEAICRAALTAIDFKSRECGKAEVMPNSPES